MTSFITPWLSTGNWLESYGNYVAVLNVAAEQPERPWHAVYLKIPLVDYQKIPPWAVEQAIQFLNRVEGLKTLIHCTWGTSRSPCIAAIYLRYLGCKDPWATFAG